MWHSVGWQDQLQEAKEELMRFCICALRALRNGRLRGETLPEGGVIRDEVEGVNRATEGRGDVPARENTTWSQTANNSG